MEEKSKKKKGVTKRDIIELSIVVVVFLVIYLTGSQAEVFGKVQQAVLITGVVNASELDADEVVDADYNFRLVNEEGNKIDVRDLKGKTIFINIWATWCPPCVAEMPNINSLYNKIENKDDIVFLMISHDDEMRTARTWIKRKGFDFPVYKLASPLPDVFETGVVPSTFVVSPEGKIVVSKTGMANYDTKRFKKYLLKLAEK
ncbi:TlpA disulfide reductase family protein [Roseivirga sp.]|uniref:TlpA family protein disulfide reductase n=1 Tax=Roseivirga sp. TaxID=1964215 RepID=UPI002B273F61|nr:TlpA disulfide reductase family protein [Roseivirga sp.]